MDSVGTLARRSKASRKEFRSRQLSKVGPFVKQGKANRKEFKARQMEKWQNMDPAKKKLLKRAAIATGATVGTAAGAYAGYKKREKLGRVAKGSYEFGKRAPKAAAMRAATAVKAAPGAFKKGAGRVKGAFKKKTKMNWKKYAIEDVERDNIILAIMEALLEEE